MQTTLLFDYPSPVIKVTEAIGEYRWPSAFSLQNVTIQSFFLFEQYKRSIKAYKTVQKN